MTVYCTVDIFRCDCFMNGSMTAAVDAMPDVEALPQWRIMPDRSKTLSTLRRFLREPDGFAYLDIVLHDGASIAAERAFDEFIDWLRGRVEKFSVIRVGETIASLELTPELFAKIRIELQEWLDAAFLNGLRVEVN